MQPLPVGLGADLAVAVLVQTQPPVLTRARSQIDRRTPAMLTRRIDAALNALTECRARLPPLRDLYRPGSAERAALDDLLEALNRTNEALRSPSARHV